MRIVNLMKRSLMLVFLFIITISLAPLAYGQNGAGESFEFSVDPQSGGIGLDPSGVLLYCGNGGNCSEGLNNISGFYSSLGATPVDIEQAFPADLSDYRLIYLIMPTQSFTPVQVAAFEDFLTRGPLRKGRLVLVGDWPTFWPGQGVGNALLKDLGVPISFNSDAIDSGCQQFTANISKDRLTRGIPASPGFEYALTNTLTLGGNAKKLLGTAVDDSPMAAVYPGRRGIRGDTVVVGDSNIFTDLCNPGDSDMQFWNNLIRF